MKRWRHKPRAARESGLRASSQARYVLMALTLGSLYGVFLILKPFLDSIILAFLLASLFRPVHAWLEERCGKRRTLAALLAVATVSLLVIVPSTLFLSSLAKQTLVTVHKASAWFTEGRMRELVESPRLKQLTAEHPQLVQLCRQALSMLQPPEQDEELGVPAGAPGTVPPEETSERPDGQTGNLSPGNEDPGGFDMSDVDIPSTVLKVGQGTLTFTRNRVVPVIAATGSLLFGFFIMLFVMFFVFRDGRRTLKYLLHLSPLPASQEQAFLAKVREVSRAVFLGVFGTAFAQALLAMVAFKIVGIPALVWGTLLGAASIVPNLGLAIWGPAVVYLLLIGHPGYATFLALWCMFVVGSVDNVLRPMFMGGGAGMSYVVVFFAILGGIQCFGPVGIVYGPLVFGLSAVCLYIYELEHTSFLARQDQL